MILAVCGKTYIVSFLNGQWHNFFALEVHRWLTFPMHFPRNFSDFKEHCTKEKTENYQFNNWLASVACDCLKYLLSLGVSTQSTNIPRVPQCLSPRPDWYHPLPLPLASEEAGESQFGRLEKKLSTVSTLLVSRINSVNRNYSEEGGWVYWCFVKFA